MLFPLMLKMALKILLKRKVYSLVQPPKPPKS